MMKTLLTILLVVPLCLSAQVSIHDIQFTIDPGDGTYPSPYAGQTVTTGGIVTATGYLDGRYFITSSQGGAWNGLFVYDNANSPAVGDSIVITGQVYEYNGLTELRLLNSFQLISTGHVLPAPAEISTQNLAENEAYESVLVKLTDVEVISDYNEYNDWEVDDGSGPAVVSDGIFNAYLAGIPLPLGYPFQSLKGVVTWSYGYFCLHPRSLEDLSSGENAYIAAAGNLTVYSEDPFQIPLNLIRLGASMEISAYTIAVEYDPEFMAYLGMDSSGTLSAGGFLSESSVAGSISIDFNGDFIHQDIGTLLNLTFQAVAPGTTPVNLVSATINDVSLEYLEPGEALLYVNPEPTGDTLTVIQRPLANIPAIVTPGETLEITCLAPENTTDWSAALVYGEIEVNLILTTAIFDVEVQRWKLVTEVPVPPFFELYDLHVTAAGLEDITRNSVQVLEQREDSYYFIQITDTHLPTHLYWYESGSFEDSTEMEDLRAVIQDINILRPQFVLITGDLVNEGELENFLNRRYYTRAQRILTELEVPAYLVAGNHDLGGWDDTPPVDGTARHDWWRFFGWNWLNDPPAAEIAYTQDYTFDYGPVHFIGLEAYLNYDGYRWDIYGSESFIPSQLEWLQNDLDLQPEDVSRVLFYHMDFANQLDLDALDVDMALYGHIHHNSGSIESPPYNLATESVCDGNRAYRVIRVDEEGTLTPEETVYASWPEEGIEVDFHPSNTGVADTVSATVTNNHPLSFDHGRIKFRMPPGEHGYRVAGGELEQVVTGGDVDVCYVSVAIAAGMVTTVEVAVDTTLTGVETVAAMDWRLFPNFPNPFNPSTTLRYFLPEQSDVQITIADIAGREVAVLVAEPQAAGAHQVVWNGLDAGGTATPAGIYLARLNAAGHESVIKMLLLR